jgi:hypothetical protein
MAAESHVIISEHGAFQSNMIYMRNASLLVDLRGIYQHGEFKNFENLARMFGVFCQYVHTAKLTSHHDFEFNVTDSELDEVVEKVQNYLTKVPYKFNLLD